MISRDYEENSVNDHFLVMWPEGDGYGDGWNESVYRVTLVCSFSFHRNEDKLS